MSAPPAAVPRHATYPSGPGERAAVRVELFGVARLAAGDRTTEVAEVRSLRDVVGVLAVRYPQLVGPVIGEDRHSLNAGYILNLNGRDFVRDLDREVTPGDAVLLLAAAAGG